MARLEPGSRVINVAAPTDDIISEILVEDGDRVEAGQPLLLLESHALRRAEHESARIQLERIALQPFEIEAQSARVRAIAAEFEHAKADVENQRGLSERGFTPGMELRNALLEVTRAQEQFNEAQSLLKKLEASMELDRRYAENELQKTGAALEQTTIRAPIVGQVLKILRRRGERSGGRPLLRLGETRVMHAVAEVHATEIRFVKPGQKARFTSPALPEPIDGVVEQIGHLIDSNSVFGEDPTAPRGVRVVQVRVRLEEDELAESLTNLEGQVRIFLDGPRGAAEKSAAASEARSEPT